MRASQDPHRADAGKLSSADKLDIGNPAPVPTTRRRGACGTTMVGLAVRLCKREAVLHTARANLQETVLHSRVRTSRSTGHTPPHGHQATTASHVRVREERRGGGESRLLAESCKQVDRSTGASVDEIVWTLSASTGLQLSRPILTGFVYTKPAQHVTSPHRSRSRSKGKEEEKGPRQAEVMCVCLR